jgi:hypothetical protein
MATNELRHRPGVHNVVLQDLCPTDLTDHFEMRFDPVAIQEVRNALDPAHATTSGCPVVLPVVGPPHT